MRKLRDRLPPLQPDDFLRLALEARSPAAAGELAAEGLKLATPSLDAESRVLLLREVFKGHIHAGRVRSAHAIARKMVAAGALTELAHADLGRASAALEWWVRAAQAYRLAARFAPARRRSLHWGASASAFHHGGRNEESLAALERATRWSTTTRPLHRAYAALVHLDAGEPVEDLSVRMADLETSPSGGGYGRYVLGVLWLHRGEPARAMPLLREFVQRNAGDPMRAATLTAELARARKALR